MKERGILNVFALFFISFFFIVSVSGCGGGGNGDGGQNLTRVNGKVEEFIASNIKSKNSFFARLANLKEILHITNFAFAQDNSDSVGGGLW